MGKRSRSPDGEPVRGVKSVEVSIFPNDSAPADEIPGPLSPRDFGKTVQETTSESMCHSQVKIILKVWGAIRARNKSIRKPHLAQLHAWPVLLSNRFNLLLLAPTGSGKTFSFGVPLTVHANRKKNSLVLVPTRELALQIHSNLKGVAKSSCSVICIHGGVDKRKQSKKMLAAEDGFIIAATTGRLLDLVTGDDVDSALVEKIRSVHHIVLDEADRLAINTDLCNQVNQVLALCEHQQSICLCSATFPESCRTQWKDWVQGRTCAFLRVDSSRSRAQQLQEDGAAPIEGKHDGSSDQGGETPKRSKGDIDFAMIPSNITQTLHVCAEHKKPRKLLTTIQKLRKGNERQQLLGIVFVGKIKKLHYISTFLRKERVPFVALHGQLQQKQREQAMNSFKCGKFPLLVATDVAARGLHVSNVGFVVNYDFPGNIEQYVHRCGRAGRNGSTAEVFSFFTRNLAPLAPDIIAVLEATNQHVDPNLRGLVEQQEPKKPKRAKRAAPESKGSDSESDDFPELKPSVALKRANVSDPSDESESSDSDSETNQAVMTWALGGSSSE